jgi:hypothetical protein
MQNDVSRQSDERHDATRRRRMEIERGAARTMHAETDLVHVGPPRGKRRTIAFGMANRSRQSSRTRSSNKIACTTAARPGIGHAPTAAGGDECKNCNRVLACTQARASDDRCVALGKHAVCGRYSPSRGETILTVCHGSSQTPRFPAAFGTTCPRRIYQRQGSVVIVFGIIAAARCRFDLPEDPVAFFVRPCGKEQRGRRLLLEAIAERDAPKTIDHNRLPGRHG